MVGGALSRRSVGGEWRHEHAATAVSDVSVCQKARNRSPDVRRKGVGRANRTAPKLFEDMLKVNFSDGERNIFDVESDDVCRWGRAC